MEFPNELWEITKQYLIRITHPIHTIITNLYTNKINNSKYNQSIIYCNTCKDPCMWETRSTVKVYFIIIKKIYGLVVFDDKLTAECITCHENTK